MGKGKERVKRDGDREREGLRGMGKGKGRVKRDGEREGKG